MEYKKPIQSRFLKPKNHSKSDAFALDVNHMDDIKFDGSKSYEETMNELELKNKKLTIDLQKAIQKNKELKTELKRKLALKAKLEDQKNTTKELELLVNVCKVEPAKTTTE